METWLLWILGCYELWLAYPFPVSEEWARISRRPVTLWTRANTSLVDYQLLCGLLYRLHYDWLRAAGCHGYDQPPDGCHGYYTSWDDARARLGSGTVLCRVALWVKKSFRYWANDNVGNVAVVVMPTIVMYLLCVWIYRCEKGGPSDWLEQRLFEPNLDIWLADRFGLWYLIGYPIRLHDTLLAEAAAPEPTFEIWLVAIYVPWLVIGYPIRTSTSHWLPDSNADVWLVTCRS